jgi:ABC-2 type transport system ATP-binding protein
VLGLDVAKEPRNVRPLINMVSGGESSGYGLLTVRENLWMFAQFYGVPSKEAYRRIDMMLKAVGLADRANTKSSDLSTGLRQKMNIVRGFVTEPRVLFLDEPTLGLDVNASRDVRRFVRNWLAEQPDRTLLLTTHYMAEADELCDRVAIINKGQVLACDTPAALKLGLQRDSLFEVQTPPLDGLPVSVLEKLDGVRSVTHTAVDGRSILNFRLREEAALAGVITTLSGAKADILKLTKHEPTLEDVFVELVGSSIEDAEMEEEKEAEGEEPINPS